MKNKGILTVTILTLSSFLGLSFTFADTTSSGSTSVKKISSKLVKTITIDGKKYKIYKNGTQYYIVKPTGAKSPKTFTSLAGAMNYAKTAFKVKAVISSSGTTEKKLETPVSNSSTGTTTTQSNTSTTIVTPVTTIKIDTNTTTSNSYDTKTKAS